MGSRKKQTVGHRYLFGVHMGVGRGPMDEMVAIKVGDRIAWTGSVTANASIQIDEPGLFGGDDKEGGIVGQLDVLMGEPTQTVNARLAAMLGGLVPAFRGVVSTFFDGLMCSGSPYPKPWSYRWRRALKGWDGEPWYPAKAVITLAGPAGEPIKAMNPAHILYECFTNADWGRGLARARLDDAAWVAAADKLYAEGFGLCLKWSRQDAIAAFMQGVVDHIGAMQFVDPATGLIVLRLIRDDYVVASLPLFDGDSGLMAIDDDDAGSQSAGVNEVVVRYRNPIDGKDRQVRVKNPGAIHAMGGVASTSKDYPGLPTAALALRVAQRDLRASTGFIKKFKVRLDRRGYQVLPGSVFRIRDTRRGIADMVLRAGRVESGPITDGAITITALQDVFGLPATSYVAVQAGGYVPPVTTPVALATGRLLEVPYRDLAGQLDRYALDNLDATSAFLAAVAGRPNTMALGFQLRARVGGVGAFALRTEGSLCPVAQLGAALAVTDTVASLVGGVGLDLVAVGGAALVGDEIVRVDAINLVAGTVTLGRACVDTVPAPHDAGAALLFYDGTGAGDRSEYTAGVSLQGKLLARTSAGLFSEAAADTLAITLGQRQVRPYPPADLRIAGLRYPLSVADVAALQWAHRNRLTQADQLVDTLAGSIAPEAGTTYSVEYRNATSGTLISAQVGVVGTTFTPLSVAGTFRMRVRVWAVRDGLTSLQPAEHNFDYSYPTVVPGVTIEVGAMLLAGAATNGDAFAFGATLEVVAALNANSAYVDVLVLQLHFDGADGSHAFPDKSLLGRVVTDLGDVAITTGQHASFGGASASFQPPAGLFFCQGLYLGTASNLPEYLNFNSSDWTVQGWMRVDSDARQFVNVLAIEHQPVGGTGKVFGMSINFSHFDGHISPSWTFDNVFSTPQTRSTDVNSEEWFHFAFVREVGKFRAFVNGRSVINRIDGGSAYDYFSGGFTVLGAASVVIGKSMISGALKGNLQEYTVHKAALYRADFTPLAIAATDP